MLPSWGSASFIGCCSSNLQLHQSFTIVSLHILQDTSIPSFDKIDSVAGAKGCCKYLHGRTPWIERDSAVKMVDEVC